MLRSSVNFWDDVVDTFETNSDNSYFIINRNDNGGVLRWPLDIVIDLNKKVKINRFKVWQRAFWYNGPDNQPYYYQSENLRSFDLFVSMDKSEWALLGSFQIEEPTNGDISQALLDEAAAGHNFNLDEIEEGKKFIIDDFIPGEKYPSKLVMHFLNRVTYQDGSVLFLSNSLNI